MKNLYHVLPAFSPDYGGVGATLFEMEEILLVYIDPHGCFGQTLYFMDPRADYIFPNIFSVGIREIDAVTGRDDLIVKKIVTALSYINAQVIVLAGTPIPMMIGTDFNALEKILRKQTGLPVISLNTDGLHPYYEGQEKLLVRLVEEFIDKDEYIIPKTAEINIIGATPLDMWDRTSIIDFRNFLHDCGITSVACWGMGNGLEYIAGANKSRLNIAVSHAGIKVCKMLENRYGIPYLIGFPIGNVMCQMWKNKIQEILKFPIKKDNLIGAGKKDIDIKRVLLIGDQITANSLRDCLMQEYGVEDVIVYTYLGFDEELANFSDRKLKEEGELIEAIEIDKSYDLIIADLIYQELVSKKAGYFLDMPHIGTSGMVGWENSINIFGRKGSKYLDCVFASLNKEYNEKDKK